MVNQKDFGQCVDCSLKSMWDKKIQAIVFKNMMG